MKIHIELDLPIPRWARNVALALAPVAVIIATTAIVRASVPNMFNDGDTLSAQKMNDNFAALDSRLAAGNAVVSTTFLIQNGGPCLSVRQDGPWIMGYGWAASSPATCHIDIMPGFFSATPTCVASNGYFVSTVQTVSALGLTVDIEAPNGGVGATGHEINIVCIGPK
jgi:hypothetical protein